MLSGLSSGMFFFMCATIAIGAWVGGAYSVYRGYQALPEDHADVPFFSTHPKLITPEVRKWRGRIYLCMAYFALSAVVALIVRSGY
jgi:hypothetical protein